MKLQLMLVFAALAAWLPYACAQTYPSKTVRIISPYPPGGLGDLLPRAIATGLSEPLGQQVIVDNRPGASQIIGMQAAAKAPPDGHTLVFGFKSFNAVDVLHVPYKGAGPAMVDVMAGHVDFMFGAAGLAEAKAGKVRVLAVTSAKRAAVAPQVPTIAESGLAGYEATIWFGILAPAGTPQPIVARVSQQIDQVLKQPQLREQFSTVEMTPSTPDAFAKHIAREIPKWRKVIEGANIVFD